MSTVTSSKKSVAVNPLKKSQPLGAALAFLGIKNIVPLFHGSQGCTAFAKVILVRHYREAIPLATTAMGEVSTILGGEENIEQAILTLVEKAQPELIGLLTTALTETRGDDMKGILKSFRQRHPELDNLPIISVSTPDYKGALQDGFAATVEQIVATDYGETLPNPTDAPQVTVLASSMLAPGDVEEIKTLVEAFGLSPLVVPDLADSLDGHLEDDYQTTSAGGTTRSQLQQLGNSIFTLAVGESMRKAATKLQERFGTAYHVFPRLSGLDAVDSFVWELSQIANREVPDRLKRQRRRLQDAILDTHFYFGREQVSLALEPDLLYQTSWLLAEMGSKVRAAVTTTKSLLLEDLPTESVTIGDLEDFEELAKGSDLLISNSQSKAIAHRLGIPLYRLGYPIFDRLGNGHRCSVGYRGTIQSLFDIGNLLLEAEEEKLHEKKAEKR